LSNTLSTERCIIAKQLLRYIYELYTDGVRAGTIHSRVKIIIIFFEFATQNNNVIRKDLSSIEKAIADYSAFLLHKIKIYDKSLNIGLTASTAHNYQTWVLSFSAFLLDIAPYKLIKGELEINSNTRQTRKTRSLPAEVIETDFNQYTTIFKTFTDMLLEDEIFPKTFELNKEKYWITHAGEIIHSSSARLKKPNVFNFDKSRNYTIDELIHLKSYKDKSKRNEAIKLFNQRKLKANTKYCSDRAYLALHACRAYFIHFLYLTGANDSTAASIVFNSNYIIENSEINFKSIKWRANGQEVKYDIQTEFIADFKKYIQIREYLLQCYDTNSDSLFLDVYKN
jgi:hypothetical protein